jgi:hypothetical protein
MWGIIPAAGQGSRIQPLAFSKELLPVGSRLDGAVERPCAVSEYLCERMITGGADKLCFVIAPGKSDILEYFGGSYGAASVAYVVQPEAAGLCDAIFRVAPLVAPHEQVLVGLPDTIWLPRDGFWRFPTIGFPSCCFPSKIRPLSMPWKPTDKAMSGKSRSNGGTPPRTGSGARSKCPALSCTSCNNFGSDVRSRTNISAP